MQKKIWPDNIKCGVALTFDLDAETFWFSRRMDSIHSPNLMAEGAYGPKVGLPRILDMLERTGVKATFFIPGWVVEKHTAACRSIVEKGHEIGYHGYLHEKTWFVEQERELIEKTLRIMHSLLGVEPRGHRAPEADLNTEMLELIAGSGFEYSSNMMDSDQPYLHATGTGHPLVELPIHWLYDDSSHFFFTLQEPARRPIAPPSVVKEIWLAEFEGLYAEEGCLTFMLHPQIIGRVSRVKMLEEIIVHIKSKPGVLIGPAHEICMAALPQLLTT